MPLFDLFVEHPERVPVLLESFLTSNPVLHLDHNSHIEVIYDLIVLFVRLLFIIAVWFTWFLSHTIKCKALRCEWLRLKGIVNGCHLDIDWNVALIWVDWAVVPIVVVVRAAAAGAGRRRIFLFLAWRFIVTARFWTGGAAWFWAWRTARNLPTSLHYFGLAVWLRLLLTRRVISLRDQKLLHAETLVHHISHLKQLALVVPLLLMLEAVVLFTRATMLILFATFHAHLRLLKLLVLNERHSLVLHLNFVWLFNVRADDSSLLILNYLCILSKFNSLGLNSFNFLLKSERLRMHSIEHFSN